VRRREILFGATALALAAWTCLGAEARIMSVQVNRCELRDAPSFLGAVVATLNYGDRVHIQEERGAWLKGGTPGGVAGWIHSSALTKKKVLMQATETVQSGASSGELALAGKGFNADVEADFRARNRDLDYTWVDKMEAMAIPSKRLAEFLCEGQVGGAKGGAQ